MSWAIGYDMSWNRDIGYGVPATCDHPGCGEEIDRGLSYVCGSLPYGGDHGCGLFFCTKHLRMASRKRGNAELCSKCYSGKGDCFEPTPDLPKWVRWKLTDPSWLEWRLQNTEEVKRLTDMV